MSALTTAQHADFHRAFVACLLASTTDMDNEDTYLDQNYDPSDLHPLTAEALRAKTEAFARENAADLLEATRTPGYTMDNAGHDLALSCNGHGAGFFDRGLGEVGDRLQDAAGLSGPAEAYVGDDGRLHVAGMERGVVSKHSPAP